MTGTVITLVLAAITLAGTPQDGRWPVDHPVIVSEFRAAEPDWAAGHRGLDLAAHPGTPVRAIAGGRVSFAGVVADKPVVSVTLTGTGALRTTFEPVVATVIVGQQVRSGDLIGFVADGGGHCGGDAGCVHVGLRTADSYLDPLRLIMKRPAVLKPLASLRAGPRMGESKGGPESFHGHVRVALRR